MSSTPQQQQAVSPAVGAGGDEAADVPENRLPLVVEVADPLANFFIEFHIFLWKKLFCKV
jgi:hypothetical protein